MKKGLLVFILLMVLGKNINAQSLYIDPTTTAALMAYSSQLRKEQEKTREEVKGLKKVQAGVGIAMAEVGRIQKKVLKGLSEVSGTISNAHQVKNIHKNIEVSGRYIKEIGKIGARHPQYSVFATAGIKKGRQKITQAYAEIGSTLASGELNLMTAGDRYKLLDKIEHETKMLRLYLLGILLPLERAERVGFWKSINPFQGYIDTDKSIVENMGNKTKHTKKAKKKKALKSR